MSFTINLQIPDGVTNAPERVTLGLQQGIQRATAYVTNQAISNAPRITGNLKRSIHSVVNTGLGKFTGNIIQDSGIAKYGQFVEFGTGIYGPKGQPITPKNAKVLAWKQNGKQIFRRSVKGMQPRLYMTRAFQDSVDQVKAIITMEIETAIKG